MTKYNLYTSYCNFPADGSKESEEGGAFSNSDKDLLWDSNDLGTQSTKAIDIFNVFMVDYPIFISFLLAS